MIVLSPSKIPENPVQDPFKILKESIGFLYLVLPRSYKILPQILLKILQESIG